MFVDYPHKNKVLKTRPGFLIKSLSNKEILYKEFYILDFLKHKIPVPIVCDLKKRTFCEELLIGRELRSSDLTTKNIKKIAEVLKKLHLIKLPKNIKSYIKNKFLIRNCYQPTLIIKEILKKMPIELGGDEMVSIFDMAQKTTLALRGGCYNICLIHGDLSYHNIFLKGDDIYLIDWTDCRLDIYTCDIVQLFYLLKFNQKQKNIFLKYYQENNPYNLDIAVLRFNEMAILLYELTSGVIKSGKIDKIKLRKILLLCKK